jgi:hypothetical protein
LNFHTKPSTTSNVFRNYSIMTGYLHLGWEMCV